MKTLISLLYRAIIFLPVFCLLCIVELIVSPLKYLYEKIKYFSNKSLMFTEPVSPEEIIKTIAKNKRARAIIIPSYHLLFSIDYAITMFQYLGKYNRVESVKLQSTSLYEKNITPEKFIELVKAITECRQLKHLTLSKAFMSNEQAIYLVDQLSTHCPKLTTIDLDESLIDDEGAKVLSQFPIALNLKNNRITFETSLQLMTAYRPLEDTQIASSKNKEIQTKKLLEINDPIKLYNYWKTKNEEMPVPSLLQLSLFAVQSHKNLKTTLLPQSLQSELRRKIIF